MTRRCKLLFLSSAALAFTLQAWQTAAPETWTFDRLDQIGGHSATILGHPRVIDTPQGKAVQFNGVDDAIFLDVHPLAGAATFTWEVVFRPIAMARRSSVFFTCRNETRRPARTIARVCSLKRA